MTFRKVLINCMVSLTAAGLIATSAAATIAAEPLSEAQASATEATLEELLLEETQEELATEAAPGETSKDEPTEAAPEETPDDEPTGAAPEEVVEIIEEVIEAPQTDSEALALFPDIVYMQDGTTYNISLYENDTYLICNTSGTFTIKGSSDHVAICAELTAGTEAKIIFDWANITPSAGHLGVNQAAISVSGSGGKLTISSAARSRNEFTGKGKLPAIRKDNKNVELHFDTEEVTDPGTIIARAQYDVYFTPGIGSYASRVGGGRACFGNVYFDDGIIDAYGSGGSSVIAISGFNGGGPGIGGNGSSDVDGVYFTGARVRAYAGDGSAAAIGTCSADGFSAEDWPEIPDTPGAKAASEEDPESFDTEGSALRCRNIVISGGYVETHHRKSNPSIGQEDALQGGAGIGGGNRSEGVDIKITGGYVESHGALWAAGIGGGYEADGKIEITGGEVHSYGGATGIGSGQKRVYLTDGGGGDAFVTIRGGVVEARGGMYEHDASMQLVGVGIGGWFQRGTKQAVGKTTIEISGGDIKAYGKVGGAGIGTGSNGRIRSLKISGGRIYAEGGENSVAIGAGCQKHTAANDNYNNGIIDHMEISGGTIVTNHNETVGGDFGGVKDYGVTLLSDPEYLTVIITGGNIRSNYYHAIPENAQGQKVYRNNIRLADFHNETVVGSKVDRITMLSAYGNPITYYGLNDVFTLEKDHEPEVLANVLHVWIPQTNIVHEVETRDSYYKDGDVKVFKGITAASPDPVYPEENGRGGMLFPKLRFRLQPQGTADYYVGEYEVLGFKDLPEDGRILKYYSLDEAGNVPLLYPDGKYYKEVEYKDVNTGQYAMTWTTSDGMLVPDYGGFETEVYEGVKLYAQYSNVEEITLKLACDGRPITVDSDKIEAKSSADGKVYTRFTKKEAGTYVFNSEVSGDIPEGEYEVTITDEAYARGSLLIDVKIGVSRSYSMDYYTVTTGDDLHTETCLYSGSKKLRTLIAPEGAHLTLEAAMADGYEFSHFVCDGTEPEFPLGKDVNPQEIVIRGKVKLTAAAKADPILYSIRYDLDGGHFRKRALGNPPYYTVESEDITLDNPEKDGYVFAGWTGTGLTRPTTTVTIAKGSTGDRSYRATWKSKEEPAPEPPAPSPEPPGPKPGPEPPKPKPGPGPHILPGEDPSVQPVTPGSDAAADGVMRSVKPAKTGDESHRLFLLFLAAASAAGLLGLYFTGYGKKKG